jgi:hypothetical protein
MTELRAQTHGDQRIGIALLDGPVDLSHPCFAGATVRCLESVVSGARAGGPARRHGTHVASVIFGQHQSAVEGVAPGCRGIIIPIFQSPDEASIGPCSQLDLARAIALAVEQGANIINISGGQFSPSGDAHCLLADLLGDCGRRGVLIVAAAGNDGCACLHVPAAHAAVLAVGAMDALGRPLAFSNWGQRYHTHGILAPGENILGAQPGGGTALGSGTSLASAIVSGVAALLLCLQLKRSQRPDPRLVREALLRTAIDCASQPAPDCRRLLAGRLNVRGSISFVTGSTHHMSDLIQTPPSETVSTSGNNEGGNTPSSPVPAQSSQTVPASASQVLAAECACTTGPPGNSQLVYALGQIGYDFVSEARMDSLAYKMAAAVGLAAARSVAFDSARLLAYLEQNPWDAAAVTWTLSLDATPIYALGPAGPFAAETYGRLREFLGQRLTEGIERISVGGVMAGTVRLLDGQAVPVLVPEIRTMYSWKTAELVNAVAGEPPGAEAAAKVKAAHELKKAGIHKFLDRVYYALRNLGLTGQDRALNFAATNAFDMEQVYEDACKEEMELDTIQVTRSPVCRPSSDCWDVELYFFYPDKEVQKLRKVHRFTVDVSDVAPVTVGPVRSWFVR